MPTITITSSGGALFVQPSQLDITTGESVQWANTTDVNCTVNFLIMSMLVPAGTTSDPIVPSAGSGIYTVKSPDLVSCSGTITVQAPMKVAAMSADLPTKVVTIHRDGPRIVVRPHKLAVSIGQYFQWSNASDVEMTIQFSDLQIPTGSGATTNQFCGEQAVNMTYTVTDPSGRTIDPEIIIQSDMAATAQA
jgi:plastocyanin